MATATDMEYRYMGKTGIKLSVISIGAWVTFGNNVDDDLAYKCLKTAFDAGCNFFDNAEAYMNGKAEVVMGNSLQRLFKEEGVLRDQLVITTKIFFGTGLKLNGKGLSRKHIIEGLNASLKRMQLDYVDVVYAHRPDDYTPIEETVRAFNHVIDKGQAFYWGTSEWSADQIMQATSIAKQLGLIAPIVEQPQYNLLHRTRFEKEYSRLYSELGLGTTIWSPLASGLLSGKYTSQDPSTFPKGSRLADEGSYKWLRENLISGEGLNGLEEKSLEVILAKIDGLRPIAKKLDCTLAQLGIAWCAKNPNVTTVITGASKVEQVVENFAAIKLLPKLTDEVMAEIEAVIKNKPALLNRKDWRGSD
eukprot:TRINITY_DN1188_c0_g1_i2.p1 TRINITY_DN1188_c0_g1~~TRINITY_DN1188_c0_g1_i2.p1  ORF type:complete len:361 (-),score=89.44 TRINITY_DN1188_c0_g1_i2:99-1181(-)